MPGENGKCGKELGLESNGDIVVGGSVRADGSVRKTLKVRPGFTPKEEVKRYDVRERRRQREEEASMKGKDDDVIRSPGSRPARQFNAINSVLKANSTNSSSLKTSSQEISPKENDGKLGDLESKLGNLNIDNKENKEITESTPKDTKLTETQSEHEKSRTKPKKYIPPSRRTK